MELIGYCRVSSKAQEDGTSLATQEQAILAAAQYSKHTMVEVVSDVETGSKLERTQLWSALRRLVCRHCPVPAVPKKKRDMIDAIERPCPCGRGEGLDGLVVFDMDRLGRDARDLLYLGFDFFSVRKKALIILNGLGTCDTTTPHGRLQFLIFAGIAQFQKETILERLGTAQQKRALANEYACGRPPYGLRRISKNTLEEVKEEQEVLRIIQFMYGQGISQAEIASYLNRCGYRKRGVKGRPGRPWDYRGVNSVLNQNQIRDWFSNGRTYNYVRYADPIEIRPNT